LEHVGVERVLSVLRSAAVGPLEGNPDDHGLRLALGAPKVRLLDLAAGYRFLVRGGRSRAASPILDIELSGGAKLAAELPRERQVFNERTSWLVMDMLADPHARREAFGYELPFDLPHPVAAKKFADTVGSPPPTSSSSQPGAETSMAHRRKA
jgi:membrane peptidoglycan carboxypeptidase